MFYYFGYGSNMSLDSIRAKGVEPRYSRRATLHGWKLLFNVRHWFPHEGGVGNICRSYDPRDYVQGVVHYCEDGHLALLDAVESYGVAYDRIEVELDTDDCKLTATTYIGIASYIDDACLPTRRYLNILLKGAETAGLDTSYIDLLRDQVVHKEKEYPQFQHPDTDLPAFNNETLREYPLYTALAGAVFDMQGARSDIDCLTELFGGKDTTLFHLCRLDSSDGKEVIDDVKYDRLSSEGKKYLNAYLHAYNEEYRYVGRYIYD